MALGSDRVETLAQEALGCHLDFGYWDICFCFFLVSTSLLASGWTAWVCTRVLLHWLEDLGYYTQGGCLVSEYPSCNMIYDRKAAL
jgi:hypothetical protein